MTPQHANAQLPKQGKRYPLLFQQRFSEQIFWPSILILTLSAALLVWNPVGIEPYRTTLNVALVCTALVLVLSLLFRLRTYARCLHTGLHLQFPFFHLTIPYNEIRSTRPTELYRMFPPDRQRWPQRYFLRALFGKTVVVVEMGHLPRPKIWLRFWMSKYMLCPDRTGFDLAVQDWMAFRAELDEFRARVRQQ
jgi:hypothetical protein